MSDRLRQSDPGIELGQHRRSSLALIRLLSETGEPVYWEKFLPVFEQWCVAQGWHVEYKSVEDESCAIFFVRP